MSEVFVRVPRDPAGNDVRPTGREISGLLPGLLQLIPCRQHDRAAMFVFLDVIPDETFLQPSSLPLRQRLVRTSWIVADGEALAAFAALDHFQHHGT